MNSFWLNFVSPKVFHSCFRSKNTDYLDYLHGKFLFVISQFNTEEPSQKMHWKFVQNGTSTNANAEKSSSKIQRVDDVEGDLAAET